MACIDIYGCASLTTYTQYDTRAHHLALELDVGCSAGSELKGDRDVTVTVLDKCLVWVGGSGQQAFNEGGVGGTRGDGEGGALNRLALVLASGYTWAVCGVGRSYVATRRVASVEQ